MDLFALVVSDSEFAIDLFPSRTLADDALAEADSRRTRMPRPRWR
jgi:hypothetical protein